MRMIILSLSRSGSTAMYYEILNAMPDRTQTYFEPEIERLVEIDIETNFLTKVIIESIQIDQLTKLASKFTNAIILVRDPRDRLISSFLFSMHGIDKNTLNKRLRILDQKRANPKNMSFLKLVMSIYPRWGKETIKNHINSNIDKFEKVIDTFPGAMLIPYESLFKEGINDVLEYFNLNSGISMNIPQRHNYGMRKGAPGDWKNWFTSEDIEFFKPLFDQFIKKFNYDNQWKIEDNPVIESDYSSNFVERAYKTNKKLEKQNIYWNDII